MTPDPDLEKKAQESRDQPTERHSLESCRNAHEPKCSRIGNRRCENRIDFVRNTSTKRIKYSKNAMGPIILFHFIEHSGSDERHRSDGGTSRIRLPSRSRVKAKTGDYRAGEDRAQHFDPTPSPSQRRPTEDEIRDNKEKGSLGKTPEKPEPARRMPQPGSGRPSGRLNHVYHGLGSLD